MILIILQLKINYNQKLNTYLLLENQQKISKKSAKNQQQLPVQEESEWIQPQKEAYYASIENNEQQSQKQIEYVYESAQERSYQQQPEDQHDSQINTQVVYVKRDQQQEVEETYPQYNQSQLDNYYASIDEQQQQQQQQPQSQSNIKFLLFFHQFYFFSSPIS